MIFKVNSNKRCGLYVEQKPNKFVTEYSTRYDWSEFFIAEKLLFSHKTNVPFGRTVLHTHDFYELTFCVDCTDAVLYTDKNSIELLPGHAVLAKPEALHMFKAESEASRRDFYCINFRTDIPFAFKELEASMDFIDSTDAGVSCFMLTKSEQKDVSRLLRDIETALAEDTRYSEAFALSYIFEIFLILSRHKGEEEASLPYRQLPELVRDVKQYIDRNFTRLHSASEVAVSSHYSREYISRSFKKHINISVYEYIVLKKILNVCELLRAGQYVEEAAINSGFNNMSSFNRHFKRIMKMTPSEYRQVNQIQ